MYQEIFYSNYKFRNFGPKLKSYDSDASGSELQYEENKSHVPRNILFKLQI